MKKRIYGLLVLLLREKHITGPQLRTYIDSVLQNTSVMFGEDLWFPKLVEKMADDLCKDDIGKQI